MLRAFTVLFLFHFATHCLTAQSTGQRPDRPQKKADNLVSEVLVADNNNHGKEGGALINACSSIFCYGDTMQMGDLTYELSYVEAGDTTTQFDTNNCQFIGQNLPANTAVRITPRADSIEDGYIGTYDLVLMSKHILNVDTFDSPYQWVSADANRDGIVNTGDIVVCRKHILGIELLEHPYRFVEKNFVFPWPGNPLAVPFLEFVTVYPNDFIPVEVEFYAIPICDVGCGNLVGFFDLEPEEQSLIGMPQPNPTTEGVQLPLQLLASETVVFELMDVAGRRQFRQVVSLPMGDAMFDVPPSAFPKSGLYFWRMQAGAVTASGKIIRN